MFELMLDARRRIDAVLTPAQREQLKRRGGGR
jgi:Spy/CpxP family protein refolding chaperone